MATAELAIALVALSVIAQLLLVAGTLVATQLQASDAARLSARLAARGESRALIDRAVREVAPRGQVDITSDAGVISARVRIVPSNALARRLIATVSSTARSVDETTAAPDLGGQP